MKKGLFGTIALLFIACITLSACNSKPSVSGNFKKDSYVVSINDTINFYDELTSLEGASIGEVEIEASNSEVLQERDNTFVAVSFGKTMVFAKYNDKTFAQTEVTVKNKFSTPTNLQVDEDGALSWDNSFAYFDESLNTADDYILEYANITGLEEIAIDELEIRREEISATVGFAFEEAGSYYARLTANGNDNIDSSDPSEWKILNYNAMGLLEDVSLIVSEEMANDSATLTWFEKENASYDVYIDGFKVAENLLTNSFTYDYSLVQEGQSIEIKVTASDSESDRIASTTRLEVEKLLTPELFYNRSTTSNPSGYLYIEDNQNASGFGLYLIKQSSGRSFYYNVSNEENDRIFFEELESGLYSLNLKALGGSNPSGHFLNSALASTVRIAKLATPTIDVQFEGENAILTFSGDSYNNRYLITYADETLIATGSSCQINLSDLQPGNYTFAVQALPSLSGTDIIPYIEGGLSSEYILNSNSATFDFAILEDIGYVTHDLSLDQSQSTFTFAEVPGANYYELYINGTLNQTVGAEEATLNGTVSITVNNLKDIAPQENNYVIDIVAGIRVEGQERAVKSTYQKTLSILPAVTAGSEQTNGYYSWNKVEGEAYYTYQIFKTGGDYSLDGAELIAEGGTSEDTINDRLDFGYYVIRVYTTSINEDRYLDSTFHDSANYFEANFLVYQQIYAPTITFVTEDGSYVLYMSKVEYGGGYTIEVYLDGSLESTNTIYFNSDQEQARYVFAENTFDSTDTYTVQVSANRGQLDDSALHTPSEKSELTVTRLAQPTFTVQEVVSNGQKSAEKLSVTLVDHASHVVIEFEESVVNYDSENERYQNSINLFNQPGYDEDFVLTFTYASGQAEGNNYFIDSHPYEVNFKRVEMPSQMAYQDGNLTFACNDENVEGYYLTIILVNSDNGNSYFREYVTSSGTIDLQSIIDRLYSQDPVFSSNYDQAESIQIELYSYKNGFTGDVYYLPSDNGTTLSGQPINIQRLSPSTLTFDKDSLTISWNQVAPNTTYDIYVDGREAISDYNNLGQDNRVSIRLSDLGYDFLTQRRIYVVSKNASYLASANSNTIYIKELASVSSINVANSDEDIVVSFSLAQDYASAQGVQVNGSDVEISTNRGSFLLSAFPDTQNFTFKVIAGESSSNYYYYDSQETTFQLINLSTQDLTVSIANNVITWDSVASDFIGASQNPLSYRLQIACGEQNYTISTTQTTFDLQAVEKTIGVKLNGDFEITVEAIIADYNLTLLGGQARGYYGSKTSQPASSKKLSAVGQIDTLVVDATDMGSTLENKLNASVTLSWQDDWSNLSLPNAVYFEVIIAGQTNPIVVTNGTQAQDYSLSLIDGQYNLSLSGSYFTQSETAISVRVVSENMITSEETTTSVNRITSTYSISLDQEGILTINDSANNSYLLQLTIGSLVVEQAYLYEEGQDNKTIDLMQEGMLKGAYGSYTIYVLAFDSSYASLPSLAPAENMGSKLQGLSSVLLREDGNIHMELYSDDFEGLTFSVRTLADGDYVYRSFLPDGTTSTYFTLHIFAIVDSFADAVSFETGRSYTFEVAINKNGQVNSDYLSFSFSCSTDTTPTQYRGLDLTKDYIIFDVPENDDTVSLLARVYTLQGSSYTFDQSLYFLSEDIRGYWCQDSETGDSYFSTTIAPSNANVTYTECYALSLNDLLAEYEYGAFYIDFARLGQSDGEYKLYYRYNYNPLKLNTVNEDIEQGTDTIVRVNGNSLVWQWRAPSDLAQLSQFRATSYYVIIRSLTDENESYKFRTDTSSFDLSEANLTAGQTYQIYVVAASTTRGVVASNETTNPVFALQYSQPLPLDVVDGRLMFNEESFADSDFMTTISSYFGQTSHAQPLYDIMGNGTYLSPYYFTTANIAETMLTIRFTLQDESGADTNTYYEVTLAGYELLPDITITNVNGDISGQQSASYFDLLEAYVETIQDVNTENAVRFKAMVETLQDSNRGLAGGGVLFDDIARRVPAGKYSLSIIHKANNGQNIDSKASVAIDVYVTAAPSVELNIEQGENSENYYTATFGSAKTYVPQNAGSDGRGEDYSYQTVTQYTMTLRYDYSVANNVISHSGYVEFDIVYLSSGWQLRFAGFPLSGGVITDVPGGDVPGFKINVTALKQMVDSVASMFGQTIPTNRDIRVDVYARSGDTGYVLNGKSAYFNLRFLELPTDSIAFENGQMTVTTTLDSTNAILMRYLVSGSEVATQTFSLTNGIAYIDLPRSGYYSYIVLSINGSISYNTMNVESSTYAITGLYKLNSPELSSQDNNLYITYNPNDVSFTTDQMLHFYLANDVSQRWGEGYYYTSNLTGGSSNYLTYHVGSVNADGEVMYDSELTASTFYAYLLGNSGIVELSEADSGASHGADYVWTFKALTPTGQYQNATMLFSSEVGSLDARMLNIIDGNPYISEGNIAWDVLKTLPTLGGEVIYQTTINYYNRVVGSSEFDTTYMLAESEIFYTTENFLDADHISQNYDYYTIQVTPLGGRELSAQDASGDSRVVTTVDGRYFLVFESVLYSDGGHVLRGSTYALGDETSPLSRTDAPILAPSESINNSGVSNGNIIFYISQEVYGGAISDENNQNAISRLSIKARYNRSGISQSVELTGRYQFATSTQVGAAGYVMVTFTPNEGQINDVNPITIDIQIYAQGNLLSKSLIIENVYKLSQMRDSYYDIRLEGDQTIIDFSEYFRLVSIAGDNTCYEIVISYNSTSGAGSQTITNGSDNKTFTIASNMTNLSVQVRDSQSSSTVNRLLILYSDTLSFNVEQTQVTDAEGNETLVISWNSNDYSFEWNWTNGEDSSDYEYYYQIRMTGSSPTSGTTAENYYLPRTRGTIESFTIKARRLGQNANTLYLYSQTINFVSGAPIDYDLFSGGDGSQSNPYLIANAEDFYDISKRNTTSEQFYFRLTTNIEIDFNQMVSIVDGQTTFLIKEFNGSLDGGGYSITLSATELYAMDEAYSDSITGLGTVNFNSYFALFQTISTGATVSNLALNLDIRATLDNTNALISPLALENFGQISNITVSSITLSRISGSGSANNVFIGGIVSINYGTIENSVNNASLAMSLPQRVQLNLGYGAIALINASEGLNTGSITNCYNNGDISLTIRTDNTSIYASGIVLNNYGSLNKVGNNGDFSLSSSQYSGVAYFTGIALLSDTSTAETISYCFNNGTFTNGSSRASMIATGIIYSLSSGTINTFVDTQGNALVRTIRIMPTDIGTNYASVGADTSGLNTTSPVATTINCGDGYSLRITASSDTASGFIATIGS